MQLGGTEYSYRSKSESPFKKSSYGPTKEEQRESKLGAEILPEAADHVVNEDSSSKKFTIPTITRFLETKNGFHIPAPYSGSNAVQLCELLLSRYESLLNLRRLHIERERKIDVIPSIDNFQQTINTKIENLSNAQSAVERTSMQLQEYDKALCSLSLQCDAYEKLFIAAAEHRESRSTFLRMLLKRLDNQEIYCVKLWQQTRKASWIHSGLAENLVSEPESSGGWAHNCLLTRKEESLDGLAELQQHILCGRNAEALRLLEEIPLNLLERDLNILHTSCAVSSPSIEVVEAIVRRRPTLCLGVDSQTGNTALHFACGAVQLAEKIVHILVHAGVQLTHKNKAGLTAFHVAALNLHDSCENNHSTKNALLHYQMVDERTSSGLTALHLICGDDHYLETTKFLVYSGADLWSHAVYQIHLPPYSIRRITPLEKSRHCMAMRTFDFLRSAMLSRRAKGFTE